MKLGKSLFLAALVVASAGYAYWRLAIPEHRVAIKSELVMLGDLDGDMRWTEGDFRVFENLPGGFFAAREDLAWRLDMNQNGFLDPEDLKILRALVTAKSDPYAAEAVMAEAGSFPRPRELYRYVSLAEYRARPLWALSYPPADDSVLTWLADFQQPDGADTYAQALGAAVRAEAVRFDQAYRQREAGLLPIERDYAVRKLERAEGLFRGGELFELLLALMELVEDAETLMAPRQANVTLGLLNLRDHLRNVLGSDEYGDFVAGKHDWRPILKVISDYLKTDLGLDYDLETLGPARNLTALENYLNRTEWQYYKTSAREEDFLALVAFAQHDSRYLRAVSRTSQRSQDTKVENHNLPMVLLFREAIRIMGGDKKKAVGLLDEAIRIPYAWIRSIPREALPSSLALDNFLLPGNMEDGSDKSRHWNVFGGICLYKSPQEALDLALRREMQDLRETNYSAEGMREFIRDMIANLNGMYHVMTVNPSLLAQ